MPAAEQIGVEAYFGISDFTRNTGIYTNTLRNLEKQTTSFSSQIARQVTNSDKAWKDNANTVRQTGGEYEKFSKSVIGQVYAMKASIDGAKIAFNAFLGPFRQFIALGTEAVGLRRTKELFTDLVGGVEEYEEAITGMREATLGTIKDTELINSAFLMMRRGYADTAENAAKLARNISLLGKSAGQVPTPEAAMQVFSLMMANQSKMRLDAFNLTIEETDARIEHLKETLKITQEEAFKIAVIELMDEKVEQLGLTAETSVTKMDRMRAQFGNISDDIKSIIVPYFDDFVNVLTNVAGWIDVNTEKWREWAGWFVGTIRGNVAVFGDFVSTIVMGFNSMKEAILGNTDAAVYFWEQTQHYFQRTITLASGYSAQQYEIRRQIGETTDTVVDSAVQQEAALAEVEQAWNDLKKATQEYEDELAKVNEELAQQTVKTARDAFYKIQDAAIAAARRREDIARETTKRIQQIEASLATAIAQAKSAYHNAVENAERQHADAKINIERDYQRRLRDIQRRFDMQIDDAIAERDATTILRLQRQRDLELTEAKEQRDEQSSDADKAYADQKVSAERAYRQQLQAAQDAYNQQMEALRQSLAEQEEEYQRSQKRREEDEQRAREREEGLRRQALGQKIADIYLNHQEELGMTRSHYAAMTAELRNYYNNVVQYYAAIAAVTGSSRGVYGGPGGVQSRQAGGYMPAGTYNVGEKGYEFALNHQTTRALENVLGGLTQANIKGLAGAGANQTMTVKHDIGQVTGRVQVAVEQSIAGMEGRIMAMLNREIDSLTRVM